MNIASQNLLPGWLSAARPDVVMMHLGTNDVWNNSSPTTILDAYSTLVGQMRASNPGMRILVARITPMNPTGCAACAGRVVDLDNAIPDGPPRGAPRRHRSRWWTSGAGATARPTRRNSFQSWTNNPLIRSTKRRPRFYT